MQSKKKSSNKVAKTLLLDVKTIDILKEYSEVNFGSNSMSMAVRAMARKWKKQQEKQEKF